MEVDMSEMSEWEKQKKFIKDLCDTWEESKRKDSVKSKKIVENKAYCTLKESFDYTSSSYQKDWDRIFKHKLNYSTEDGDGSLLNEAAKRSRKKKVGKKSTAKKSAFKENKPNKKPFDLLNPDSFSYVDKQV
jgi:hypothetical protein